MADKELTDEEKAEQVEAYKQLPAEVRASLGKVIKYAGKWAVQLPPVHFRQGGKEKHLERFLSSNGEAMRVFHTKQQAEEALGYYQQLMIARAAMREEQEKAEDLKVIGSWDKIAVDTKGLPVEGTVKYDCDQCMEKIRAGDLRGLSIGYRVEAYQIEDGQGHVMYRSDTGMEAGYDYDDLYSEESVRVITKLDLVEISVEAGEFLNAEPWQPTTWSATNADE